MRSFTLTLATVVVAGALAPAAAAPRFPEAPYHLEFAHRPLGAGEQLGVRLSPPPPAGIHVGWRGASPAATPGEAVVRAPYVIAPGTPPREVSVVLQFDRNGPSAVATAQVELAPGHVAGADDCLGPGQSWSTTEADIVPHSTFPDELPEAIVKPPPPAAPPGVKDLPQGLIVEVLVCRTGRVLDAIPHLPTGGHAGAPAPPPPDPRIVEAAVDAARRFVFKPAVVHGEAVAVWVAIPFRFDR